MSCYRDGFPAGLLRHEEDIVHQIGVRIVFEPVAIRYKLLVLSVERSGNIAQKDKADDDLPVFRRRDMSPQDACCIPYLFLKANIGVSLFCH